MRFAFQYEKDPAAIYRRSFAVIEREADLSKLHADMKPVAARLIHACGMPDIVSELAYWGNPVESGREALAAGAPILVDAEMVAHGVIRNRLPAGNDVICTLNGPDTPEAARRLGTTRSAAALEGWRDRLEGAVVAIGNAPTALFHLLEMIANGGPRPSVIFGFPVGFVGAEESKDALVSFAGAQPFLTLLGRRGGSAMAAAAVNAVARREP